MAVFFNNAVTDVGKMLMLHVQAGAVFTPTKIVVGSGYIPSGKTVKTMTAVATPVKNIAISEKSLAPSGGSAIIGGVFTNKDTATAFFFRELGLYAKCVYEDGTETDEVLYSYGNSGDQAETIPAYSTETLIERMLRLIVYVGNDTAVDLNLDSAVVVDRQTFDNTINQINMDIEAAANMTDATTGKKYRWGIDNGAVYVEEV